MQGAQCEFGVFGGAPFASIIADYSFGKHPEDIELLERVSNVAAAAHAPFITGADPSMMNLDGFNALDIEYVPQSDTLIIHGKQSKQLTRRPVGSERS